MKWLRRTIDGGITDIDWMVQDSDVVSLHGPEFDALVEDARRRQGRRPRSHRVQAWNPGVVPKSQL